jgi:tetratricopeptide (TPR) repeat protein
MEMMKALFVLLLASLLIPLPFQLTAADRDSTAEKLLYNYQKVRTIAISLEEKARKLGNNSLADNIANAIKKADELMREAENYYKSGNYTEARKLALEVLDIIRNAIRDAKPVAQEVRREIAISSAIRRCELILDNIKAVITRLNLTGNITSLYNEASSLLDQAKKEVKTNVTLAGELVKQAGGKIKEMLLELKNYKPAGKILAKRAERAVSWSELAIKDLEKLEKKLRSEGKTIAASRVKYLIDRLNNIRSELLDAYSKGDRMRIMQLTSEIYRLIRETWTIGRR